MAILLAALFLPPAAMGQTRTTVADTIYDPTGTPLIGYLIVTNQTTFTSPDGFQIPAGNQITVTVTDGAFSVQLVPNLGATPVGTSYRVQYYLGSLRTVETWVMPQTPNPANLSNVRALAAPVPSAQLAIAQVNPPSPCSINFFLAWQGAGWSCAQPAFSVSPATPTMAGIIQLAGDLGNTSTAPQVTSTHLAGALPVAQGGTGTGTAFSTGSVVFAASGGVYSQDPANFSWNSSTHRLGIGNTAPALALDVAGSIRSALNTLTFSATPTFDASLGNTQKITLTANVTASHARELERRRGPVFHRLPGFHRRPNLRLARQR